MKITRLITIAVIVAGLIFGSAGAALADENEYEVAQLSGTIESIIDDPSGISVTLENGDTATINITDTTMITDVEGNPYDTALAEGDYVNALYQESNNEAVEITVGTPPEVEEEAEETAPAKKRGLSGTIISLNPIGETTGNGSFELDTNHGAFTIVFSDSTRIVVPNAHSLRNFTNLEEEFARRQLLEEGMRVSVLVEEGEDDTFNALRITVIPGRLEQQLRRVREAANQVRAKVENTFKSQFGNRIKANNSNKGNNEFLLQTQVSNRGQINKADKVNAIATNNGFQARAARASQAGQSKGRA